MLKKIEKKILAMSIAAKNAVDSFTADVKGSDTTEKVGMVVVAVVIVGLLAAAVKKFMPGLFSSLFGTAQKKLEGIFT